MGCIVICLLTVSLDVKVECMRKVWNRCYERSHVLRIYFASQVLRTSIYYDGTPNTLKDPQCTNNRNLVKYKVHFVQIRWGNLSQSPIRCDVVRRCYSFPCSPLCLVITWIITSAITNIIVCKRKILFISNIKVNM